MLVICCVALICWLNDARKEFYCDGSNSHTGGRKENGSMMDYCWFDLGTLNLDETEINCNAMHVLFCRSFIWWLEADLKMCSGQFKLLEDRSAVVQLVWWVVMSVVNVSVRKLWDILHLDPKFLIVPKKRTRMIAMPYYKNEAIKKRKKREDFS